MERVKRVVSLVLCLVMVFGLLPMSAFAVSTDDTLTAALDEAKSYINSLTVNNSSNDPATVVSTWGKYFTWDNEKRESSSTKILYEWSYYNGVVFEGLEYLYEITGEEMYKDYIVEYMSSMIQSNGDWYPAPSSSAYINNIAGYLSNYGADCYKTASLLLDTYEMTDDDRYLKRAEQLYLDLNEEDNSSVVLLPNAGNNYRHLWDGDSASNKDLWLDGLYMILPFRAEYAKYIGDQEELDLIVSRMQWVSDNMYNSSKGLFYHAADSASSNSGTYWLRSIGWYAAAIVDIMDSMEGDNLEAMKVQLVKLVDGMKACQNTSNGMWLNNMNASQSSSNPYETSGTALVCYAVMKAVNNGWLDESYADMAILAFKGICEEKLTNNNLTDICFKGVPSGSNSTFYDNEGKGVGPFIMFYAEVLEYVNSQEEEEPEVTEPEVTEPEVTEPEVTEPEVTEPVITHISVEGTTAYAVGDDLTFTTLKAFYEGGSIDLMDENGYPVDDVVVTGDYDMNTVGSYSVVVSYAGFDLTYFFTVSQPESLYNDSESGISISGSGVGISDVSASVNTEAEGVVAKAIGADGSVTFSLSGTFLSSGYKAEVTLPVDESWENVAVYHVDGDKYTKYDDVDSDPTTYTFVTGHFSDWEQTYDLKAAAETGWVTYEGESYYTMESSMEVGSAYVITRNGYQYALARYNTSVTDTGVSITDNGDNYSIATVTDAMKWYIDSSNHVYCVINGTKYYLNVSNGSLSVGTSASSTWTVTRVSDTTAQLSTRSGSSTYYLRYTSDAFSVTTSTNNATRRYMNLYCEATQPGGQARLNGELEQTVSVGDGTTQDEILNKVTVEWDSDLDGVADSTIALSECDVTGTYDNATAGDYTLTVAYNGKTLGTVTVHVNAKTLDESFTPVLKGNDPVVTDQGVEPDFSNITLEVKFEGDEANSIITVENGLQITGYEKDVIGFYYATISYMGVEYGTVRVTVEGNPYAGKEEATVYPEYPADGSVRIDKTAKELDFATTGLVEVELDVAGVSVKGAVDVILVTDLSNSMAWAAGGRTDATSHAATKMYDLAESVNSFADIFLADNEDGSQTINTMSLVTFGGYDADYTEKVYTAYADPTQTLILGTKDASLVKTTVGNIRILADDALNLGTSSTGYYLSFDGGETYGENYGNTNYDHAFMQTANAITALKNAYTEANDGASYETSGRQIYVIFMTDGAPSNYDGVYYNYKTGDRADVNCTWINADGEEVTYTMGTNSTQYQAGPWFEYIAGGTYDATTGTIPGNPLYWADQVYNTPGVADIINIGFDLDNGGFSSMTFTESDGRPLAKVLEKLVTGKSLSVYSATDAEGIKKIYADLATELRYAGTQAEATDVIDSDFTLQMSDTTGTVGVGIGTADVSSYNPSITIKLYDLWTKDETTDTTLIGTRQKDADGNLIVDVLETVEFNADGTVATSNLKDGNILSTESDGTVIIDAYYFTYTKTPEGVETFKWSIGNITDKEIALSFMAYLKGSLEGEEANGLKYTNEEATLEYIDINDKHATQTFPVPAVAWGGASTAYEFYLVNEDGKPCDRNGNEIPFANRIIITGPFYQDLYLNQGEEEIAKEIVAVKVLPAGYTLYDETAMYTVQTASGDNEGYLKVSDPADGKAQTTIVVDYVEKSYIQSRVAFGVMYNDIPTDSDFVIAPDRVVIDYGKSIVIDVNANNTAIPSDVTATLIGFSMFYDSVDVTQQFSNTPYSAPFEGKYGTFELNSDGDVVYQPHKMVNGIGQVFCVYRLTKGTDTYYMVSELDVIPATVMYYETDFADWYETTNQVGQKVFTVTGFGDDQTDGTVADDPQDMSNIGDPAHVYGYDSSYNNDYMLSNGVSEFAVGAGIDTTTATFSFTGTGFDVISRTGELQGMIKVQVYTDATMTNRVKNVTVLNKSESSLELYQIPVVSIQGLSHGTYYVKIGVYEDYDHATIEELDRGAEFYFDAIRVYDPAQGNAIAETAYNDDGEANEQIVEVRELLITAKTFEAIASGSSTAGAVFVDSTYQEDGNADHVSGNVGVTDYAAIGPNNELYLTQGQAVAFKFKANNIPATFDIGAKTINGVAGQTATMNVTIRNADGTKSWTVTKEIGSSTVQFIDLFNNVDSGTVDKTMLFADDTYIVITNTGSGILSITDIKAAYSVNTAEVLPISSGDGNDTTVNGSTYDPYAVSYSVDAQTLSVAESVLLATNGTDVETDEPEVDASACNIIKASAKNDGNSKYTVTVVTSQEVEDVLVMQGSVELEPAESTYVDNADDTRTWTIVVSNGVSSRYGFFTLIGVGEGGIQGAAFNVAKSR